MISGSNFLQTVGVALSFILCVLCIYLSQTDFYYQPIIFAASNQVDGSLITQTRFEHKIITTKEPVAFTTTTEFDPNIDQCDLPQIKTPGKIGTKYKDTEITYYDGKEFGRRVADIRIDSPKPQVEVKGTKIVYKTLKTANGDVQYSCFLGNFRATAYDFRCKGCNDRTAIGMKAGFGVVAVDPKVIPLRTKLYITGYGPAIAGDTGGAIKGKRVDLGFDLIDKSWGVRTVEVYSL